MPEFLTNWSTWGAVALIAFILLRGQLPKLWTMATSGIARLTKGSGRTAAPSPEAAFAALVELSRFSAQSPNDAAYKAIAAGVKALEWKT